MASCAHQPTAAPAARQVASVISPAEFGGNHYWWHARFKQPWPEQNETPEFYKNLIVAHEIVAVVLGQYSRQIKLWRFHRRAARDAAGHQFSFIFYASPETARTVFHSLLNNRSTAELIENKVILELRFDDPDVPQKSDIGDTSDPSWPAALRQSWPYFMMGVSLMWLDMLEREIDQNILRGRALPARLDYYKKVNGRLTGLWREQGRHAFLHHISGIFGYEPVDFRF